MANRYTDNARHICMTQNMSKKVTGATMNEINSFIWRSDDEFIRTYPEPCGAKIRWKIR